MPLFNTKDPNHSYSKALVHVIPPVSRYFTFLQYKHKAKAKLWQISLLDQSYTHLPCIKAFCYMELHDILNIPDEALAFMSVPTNTDYYNTVLSQN